MQGNRLETLDRLRAGGRGRLAPAQWAAGALRSASGGRLDLAGASGSLWRGSAILVVSAGAAGSARASLPEPLSWRLSPWALFTGTLDLTLSHPSALAQPLVLRASPGSPARTGIIIKRDLVSRANSPASLARAGRNNDQGSSRRLPVPAPLRLH